MNFDIETISVDIETRDFWLRLNNSPMYLSKFEVGLTVKRNEVSPTHTAYKNRKGKIISIKGTSIRVQWENTITVTPYHYSLLDITT